MRHAPIEVDALTAAFHDAYRRLGGTPDQPDARVAWRAFRELALQPVVPGDVAPEVDEDFFMVEVSAGGEYRPELSIRRSVGLADEKHDHLETVHFWLAVFHEDHNAVPSLRSGSVYASFPAERDPADVAASSMTSSAATPTTTSSSATSRWGSRSPSRPCATCQEATREPRTL